MAQKDKVKELVGRGLNSYHTKALQQVDRIEKKNKEQNHKISILSNELDNDYLTKTEEGSVVSLEHSKEGMVYLDELQGNTLVNYCTDGSKEMTLNGDIDVEGTFVATTEGVDNGKVDVMCEGNTLVNLVDLSRCTHYVSELKMCSITITEDLDWKEVGVSGRNVVEKLKPNTNYTVFMYIQENTVANGSTFYMNMSAEYRAFITNPQIPTEYTGLIIRKLVTKADFTGVTTALLPTIRNAKQGQKVTFKYMIIEGDLTNVDNLEYFEGMKSVGECEDNKIEILSQNKNLFRKELVQQGNLSGGLSDLGSEITHPSQYKRTDFIKIKPNTIYSVSMNGDIFRLEKKMLYDENKKCISNISSNTFNSGSAKYLRVVFEKTINTEVETDEVLTNHNIQIEEGNVRTDYKIGVLNKKEILLNEPLRGLPSGAKDQMVKIGGKYYVEKKCVAITLDETYNWSFNNTDGTTTNRYILDLRPILPALSDGQDIGNTLCDKGITSQWSQTLELGVSRTGGSLFVYNKSCTTLAEFKNWISNNNLNLIMKLATPIYEPLEIEPTLNTYNDVTHISNNSIIPCNMQVKNTGYNTIIKPSTLYTVALDTNKSGTVGMNLGGAKATTINNVATITTPAILTDDSLRLYGKGIKGSKVRLLEGDKTNWIPSHFEGMMSSFEDKFDTTDNTYKMEILSNNKNLFDVDAEYYKAGWDNPNYQRNGNGFSFDAMNGWNSIGYEVKGHRDKTVVVSATVTCVNKDTSKLTEQSFRVHTETWSGANGTSFLDGETKRIKFNVKLNHEGRVYFNGSSTPEGSHNGGVKWIVKDILIEDIDSEIGYFPRQSNKIQFSSIEPLRGVGDVKDRFVFKDGKLMIERNCGYYIFNENTPWIGTDFKNKGHWIRVDDNKIPNYKPNLKPTLSIPSVTDYSCWSDDDNELEVFWDWTGTHMYIFLHSAKTKWDVKVNYSTDDISDYMKDNPVEMVYELAEPTYEEIPFELQKIILEGYENGTLFFDTNIPPTSTVTYAGETPIVKVTKLNKTEVSNNTDDINDNIIPYLMDMDYRVVCLQLQSEEFNGGVAMARLFGGAYEMLQRDIQSKRYSTEEYKYRLDAYLSANKITEEEYNKLGDMLNE